MKRRILPLTIVLMLLANAGYTAEPKNTIAKTVTTTRKTEVLAHLPKEKSELLETTIDTYKSKVRPLDDKIKSVRKELKDLLSADTFNAEEYIKKSNELVKLDTDKSILKSSTIAELAPKLTPSERKIMLKSFNSSKKTKTTKKPKA